jgi:uncharacterized protein (DUF302 family)
VLLEKVREIRRIEDNTAEQKVSVQSKAKRLAAKAHEDGAKLVEEFENSANAKYAAATSDAEKKSAEIIEKAQSDSKVEALAKKLEAERNVSKAVKYIEEIILKDFE